MRSLRRFARRFTWLCLLLTGVACRRETQPPLPVAERALRKPRLELTIVATAHETQVPPDSRQQQVSRLLALWRNREGGCEPGVECNTLPVSAGDHWRGSAAADQTFARSMRQLGYVASVVGEAELSLAPGQLHSAIDAARVPHLAEQTQHSVQPSLLIEREGVKLELVGLSKLLMARDEGDPMRAALEHWANAVHAHGAHVGVVISDACVRDLAQIFTRYGQAWAFLVLAIGQACDATEPPQPIHSVTLLPAPPALRAYGRARLTFDRHTGALLRAQTAIVNVVEPSAAQRSQEQ